MTATFTGAQSFRNVDNPAGRRRSRSTRFPYVCSAAPRAATPLAVGVSYSTYTNRDFTLATVGHAARSGTCSSRCSTRSPRRGGISDLRIAGSFKARERA